MTPNDYAEACERAAAICYLTVGPPEYRSEMAERMVTDADKLRALATALREATFRSCCQPPECHITLPTEPI